MLQQGQIIELKSRDRSGKRMWAYRYRVSGRGSQRVQRGGYLSEHDAHEALERALERARRDQGSARRCLTVRELVDEYLSQHDVEPATRAKLHWLLGKAVTAFGDQRLGDLKPRDIAAWRMTIPAGHRFDTTQAFRQVLARAIAWGLIDSNPAKVGVTNPQKRPKEMRPFESWAEIEAVASRLRRSYEPMIIFAAATGLRPSEWIALECRDIDLDARVVYVRRAFTDGRLKCTKTPASIRAVPLQALALRALERIETTPRSPLLFPAPQGGYLDLHNFP